jgi:hypothetical protein
MRSRPEETEQWNGFEIPEGPWKRGGREMLPVLRRVRRSLGHSRVTTTMIYAHLAPEDEEIKVL